jgi:hypothetical protein
VMEPEELAAQPGTRLWVQMGKGLIKEEDFGPTHDRTAYSHPLALAAGKCRRLPVQNAGEAKQFRDLSHAPVRLGFGTFAQTQTESQVLIDGEMGIERRLLKHHRHTSVFGRASIHRLVVEGNAAARRVLETRDQAQSGRFATARRPDEDEGFMVLDREADIVGRADALALRPAKDFGQMFDNNPCHATIVEGGGGKVERERSDEARAYRVVMQPWLDSRSAAGRSFGGRPVTDRAFPALRARSSRGDFTTRYATLTQRA